MLIYEEVFSKVIAMTFVIGTFVCSANIVSVNAGEAELLKKIVVSDNLKTENQYTIGGNDLRDNTTYMREITEVEMPYYVGKMGRTYNNRYELDPDKLK